MRRSATLAPAMLPMPPPHRPLRRTSASPPRPSVRGMRALPRWEAHSFAKWPRTRSHQDPWPKFFQRLPATGLRSPKTYRRQTRKQVNRTCRHRQSPDEQLPELPCHVSDPDLWFADSPSELERAKALCADCPIRRVCLAEALERRRAVGSVGRRDSRSWLRGQPQTATRTPPQGLDRRVERRKVLEQCGL